MKNLIEEYTIDEETRKKLGLFIEKLRIEKKFGQNQFSIKYNITKSLLSKLERGITQKINPFILKKIAKGLGIDFKIFYKIVGYLDEDEETDAFITLNLPVYTHAMLDSELIDLEEKSKYRPFSFFLEENITSDHYLVEINSDSMFPTFFKGDIAIVNPNPYGNYSNQICLVTYKGKTMIKKVVRNNDYILLSTDNPNKSLYPDTIILKKDFKNFICNGIFVQIKRNL